MKFSNSYFYFTQLMWRSKSKFIILTFCSSQSFSDHKLFEIINEQSEKVKNWDRGQAKIKIVKVSIHTNLYQTYYDWLWLYKYLLQVVMSIYYHAHGFIIYSILFKFIDRTFLESKSLRVLRKYEVPMV